MITITLLDVILMLALGIYSYIAGSRITFAIWKRSKTS
jgi:hypothetical protein